MSRSISCTRSTSFSQSPSVASSSSFRGDNAGRAKRAKPGAGQGAVSIDRAIACGGAPFVIFGQKYYDGHAAAGVDAQLGSNSLSFGRSTKRIIDFSSIGFGDPVNQRTLLDAIAAPDAAEDQNFHFPHKAGDKLLLRIGQVGGVIDLGPAALLLFGAGLKVAVVGETRCKFIRKVGSVCHGWRIIYRAISVCCGAPVARVGQTSASRYRWHRATTRTIG